MPARLLDGQSVYQTCILIYTLSFPPSISHVRVIQTRQPPQQAIILRMAVKMAVTGKAEKDGRSDDEEEYEASDGEKED